MSLCWLQSAVRCDDEPSVALKCIPAFLYFTGRLQNKPNKSTNRISQFCSVSFPQPPCPPNTHTPPPAHTQLFLFLMQHFVCCLRLFIPCTSLYRKDKVKLMKLSITVLFSFFSFLLQCREGL